MIKQLPTFPAAPRYYSEDVAEDIVAQYSFRNNSLINEADPSQSAALSGTSAMSNGRLTTADSSTSSYTMPVDYFGEADFTIEFNFRVESIGGEALVLLGQWYNGSVAHDDNRFSIRMNTNGTIYIVFAKSKSVAGYTGNVSTLKAEFNRDQHLVVERHNGVIKVYVDGVLFITRDQPEPLLFPTGNVMNGHFYNASGYGKREIWNIRVAKRAMYKGKVPRPSIREFENVEFLEYLKFHGTVSTADLITGSQLATAIGLTAGTAKNNTEPWLCFEKNGTFIYVARKPYRVGVSWNNINSANAVYGNRTVNIKGKTYKVRLLTGSKSDPSSVAGGEWDELMYSVGSGRPANYTGPIFANYSNSQLGVGTGTATSQIASTVCQETMNSNTANCIRRGRDGLTYYAGLPKNDGGTTVWWRPVLELVDGDV